MNAAGFQVLDQRRHRAELDEAAENRADPLRLRLIDDELAILDVVTERRRAAHPHPLIPGSGELVADAFADHLALELGE